MKRNTIQKAILILLEIISNKNNIQINKNFILICIKNKKILNTLLLLYKTLFDITSIDGYKYYFLRLQLVYNNFLQLNSEIIKQNNSDLLKLLLYNLKLLIFNIRQNLYTLLWDKIINMQKDLMLFMEQNYDTLDILHKFNYTQIPDMIDNTFIKFILLFEEVIQTNEYVE